MHVRLHAELLRLIDEVNGVLERFDFQRDPLDLHEALDKASQTLGAAIAINMRRGDP